MDNDEKHRIDSFACWWNEQRELDNAMGQWPLLITSGEWDEQYRGYVVLSLVVRENA